MWMHQGNSLVVLHTQKWYTVCVCKVILCLIFGSCIVCNNVTENHRLEITYENNLIIKLVLVGIQVFMSVVFVRMICSHDLHRYTVKTLPFSSWWLRIMVWDYYCKYRLFEPCRVGCMCCFAVSVCQLIPLIVLHCVLLTRHAAAERCELSIILWYLLYLCLSVCEKNYDI